MNSAPSERESLRDAARDGAGDLRETEVTGAPNPRPGAEGPGESLHGFALSAAASVALNLIRVVSAQLVVVGHAASFFKWQPQLQAPRAPDIQNIGVVVFFVLSGFLITHSTAQKLARGPYDFRRFFLERFVRIYSGLIPALFVIALFDIAHSQLSPATFSHKDALNLPTFAANVAMFQEHPVFLALHRLIPGLLPIPTRFGSARPLWTVSVEWWIYLTFGWLFLRGRWSREQVGPIPGLAMLVFFASVPVWNFFTGFGNGLTMTWILGGAVALILRRNGRTDAKHLAWELRGSTLLLVALAFSLVGFIRIYAFTRDAYDPLFATCLSFALLFLVVGLQSGSTRETRPSRVIGFLADYSYMLYLIHYTVLECFLPLHELPALSRVLMSLVASNIIAAMLASATEMKHRQWTKRLILWVEKRSP
jgi:peptidoglycan/LPS O-acetylase OafA/YrhL